MFRNKKGGHMSFSKYVKGLMVSSLLIAQSVLATDFQVDVSSSKLEWFASKVTGKHNGEVKLQSGSLVLEGDQLKSGMVVIDMKSITVLDIQDPKYNKKFVGHMHSADFFETDKFAKAVLKIKSATKSGDNTYQVKAELMIKGYTNEVTFPATIQQKEGKLHASAELEINRAKWHIKYGSTSFFKGLGDKAIHDEIKFKVHLMSK